MERPEVVHFDYTEGSWEPSAPFLKEWIGTKDAVLSMRKEGRSTADSINYG